MGGGSGLELPQVLGCFHYWERDVLTLWCWWCDDMEITARASLLWAGIGLVCLFGLKNEVTYLMRDLNIRETSKLPTTTWFAESQGRHNFHSAWGSWFCYVLVRGPYYIVCLTVHWTNLLAPACLISLCPDRCEGAQVDLRFFPPQYWW